MTRRALRIAAVIVACAAGAACVACGGDGTPAAPAEAPVPAPPPEAIVKELDGGPARITLRLWPAQPTLGDSIWLQVEVTTAPGVTVELPFEQGALGRFAVQRYVTDTTRTDDGGARRVDTYELAAPMSGRHRIPPFRALVTDGRGGAAAPDAGAGAAAGPVELLTDELPLEVGPVLADRTDRALRPAPGALPTTVGARSPWPAVAGGAAAVPR